ncbi:uncharacterized protein CXQ87_004902 [Candidozyma duobushaemuli]|uniref:Pseudouridine synthase RsuA/RluA-like domain-containing protein n=1 Tax=Candidozyma duobushaemuli TaxID=1231522 RepID=A0A2V1AE41_9ASCO|nr:uncharacterized protein CXQ87_004902 [[Candida] duobushaemulonis]PVH16607.1 hypothetical protein CXQ87_004902 [[Candida] duobushaemulonis]
MPLHLLQDTNPIHIDPNGYMTKPKYIIEHGFRRVSPYYHDFSTTVKARWFKKPIAHVLTTELGQDSKTIEQGIQDGSIYISTNCNKVDSGIKLSPEETRTHLFRNHDILHATQHVHEPPILYKGPIEVVTENDDIVAVSKPSGMPTHPSGAYRWNSLTSILREEHGYRKLYPCHRLDKATSGVLLLAKNAETSSRFQSAFNDKNNTDKWYLARVKGRFPSEPFVFDHPVFSLSYGGYINIRNTSQVPISSTGFELVKYSEELDQSIENSKGQFKLQIEQQLHEMVRSKLKETGEKFVDLDALVNKRPELKEQMAELKWLRDTNHDRELKDVCPECSKILLSDPVNEEIYLHAHRLRHRGDISLDITTKMPEWANI